MSFLSQSVSIPVWLLILLVVAVLPLMLNLYRLVSRFKRGEIVREEHSEEVLWKIKNEMHARSPKKTVKDFARDKRNEEKTDIVHVLKIMAKEGEKGILIQSVADRMHITMSKTQQAMKKLVEKKLVEEVVGVSGIKYYLTELGKNYCASKGIL
jgi:predicted transcriptional regulator